MMKHSLRLFGALVCLSLWGCGARYDVELKAPDLALDTINPSLAVLAKALPQHPAAHTLRLSWRIVPDPSRPLETLPHSFVYDRGAKTLAYHHNMPFYDLYSGATDPILKAVGAKKGGVRLLLKNGCTRSFPAEN